VSGRVLVVTLRYKGHELQCGSAKPHTLDPLLLLHMWLLWVVKLECTATKLPIPLSPRGLTHNFTSIGISKLLSQNLVHKSYFWSVSCTLLKMHLTEKLCFPINLQSSSGLPRVGPWSVYAYKTQQKCVCIYSIITYYSFCHNLKWYLFCFRK